MSGHRYYATALIILANAIAVFSQQRKPNLIVIFTDEHNLRTLGCYREYMKNMEGNVWGRKVNVETPHIDSLAEEGAIYLNFNAVAPLCTPSRASFMTGQYPFKTGAWMNHSPMNADQVTWARILQLEDYYTGYIGKWHLNGEAKPDFANKARNFGFEDTRYMYNRGHWKLFDEEDGIVTGYDWVDRSDVKADLSKAYATDFIFDKGIKFIRRGIRREKPFALMMSIPDPHGPNDVRPPYDTMFKEKNFKLPDTAIAAYNKQPASPGWSALHTDLRTADKIIEDLETKEDWQEKNRNYLGMVKLIDDNVGKLLDFLKETDQDDNTVIVFTSDHGDMMGEHAKYNKGKPYKTSAGVPMIIRYRNGIVPGKVLQSVYTSPDFAPTILSLMGINHSEYPFQGSDESEDLLNNQRAIKKNHVRFMTDSKQAKWAAAMDRDHKLVISFGDVPWLFATNRRPDETVNDADSTYPTIIDAQRKLKIELFHAMKNYTFPMANSETLFFDRPFCSDPRDQIPSLPFHICADLRKREFKNNCKIKEVQDFCPDACRKCCEDSSGEIWHNGDLITCPIVKANMRWNRCKLEQIKQFCPVTCQKCIPEPSSEPSQKPSVSFEPSASPTQHPSLLPSNSPSDEPTYSPSDAPSQTPTDRPSAAPSSSPSGRPSDQPTLSPSDAPSRTPTDRPSDQPTSSPSDAPSQTPSARPSRQPTSSPSDAPSQTPTDRPSAAPSSSPSGRPSDQPTLSPSDAPSRTPTDRPSDQPTSSPSDAPSQTPSARPSRQPTSSPSDAPSQTPTDRPSAAPSSSPSGRPSDQPTLSPSDAPSRTPTSSPSGAPSDAPSAGPTAAPSSSPSARPSDQPTSSPSATPSQIPTDLPSSMPSSSPSDGPSSSPSTSPTAKPSSVPSNYPSSSPSHLPTSNPSARPSQIPTDVPTAKPSITPSSRPSYKPSTTPSSSPSSDPTENPSMEPSVNPSNHPSNTPTSKPSLTPTIVPSSTPSDEPSTPPSSSPSNNPTLTPSDEPSAYPSISPSATPTVTPSDEPSSQPSSSPSTVPTLVPSKEPSNIPTLTPSNGPSAYPSVNPSKNPSSVPSVSAKPSISTIPTSSPSDELSAHPSTSVSPSTLPTTFTSTHPTQNPSRTPISDWMGNFQRSLSQNKNSDSRVQKG